MAIDTPQVTHYRQAVEQALSERIADDKVFGRQPPFTQFEQFLAPAKELLRGGKRTRALLLAAGWQLILPSSDRPMPAHAGAALELYQASALVHDDVVDESPVRRGMPAVHIQYSNLHREERLIRDADAFGVKSALLLGDYLLSLAAIEFELATQGEEIEAGAAAQARLVFHRMTAEVAFGQYLDNHNEYLPLDAEELGIDAALAVLYHKAARYSVDLPLRLGAILAGASAQQLELLSGVGIPLGEAFQLRDDVLGVFGDSKQTGKPAGIDLVDGKRTVLLALTQSRLSKPDRERFDTLFGRPVSDAELTEMRELIVRSGAFAKHEEMIATREQQAKQAATLLAPRLTQDAPLLSAVMDRLTQRTS